MSGTGSAVKSAIPAHVALVMDGNGRWATRQGLPRLAGHRAGIYHVDEVSRIIKSRGVRYMTLYMFSTENWRRSREEVGGIFDLLIEWLEQSAPGLRQEGIALRHIGRRQPLPPPLLDALDAARQEPLQDAALTVCMAINYGGRAEITDAVKHLIGSGLSDTAIDEAAINGALYTAGIPDPDLIIRPGGELRLSNYLLWQAAYAELYFNQVLWPDFGEEDIDRALQAYAARQRRFGGL